MKENESVGEMIMRIGETWIDWDGVDQEQESESELEDEQYKKW
jgi:hypothetical protein